MTQGADRTSVFRLNSSAPGSRSRWLHGCGRKGRKPRLEIDRAFDLPALAQSRNNLPDQQLPGIGMNPRVEGDARRDDALANV